MAEIVDVVIVGYGPVGQALALRLLQQGHRVTVIERWAGLYALPRAVGIDHEAMRILQSLGVAESFLPHTCQSQRYEWRNAADQVLLTFDGMDTPALSGWPAMTGFSQPALEDIVDRQVRNHAAATIRQGWEVTSIDEHAEHVLISLRPTGQLDAAPNSIAARYVVGCDGAGSFVRQAMDSRYHELGFSADWLVVDVIPKDPAHWNTDLIQVCDPARPTTLVASGPGRRRLEFMLLPHERKEAMDQPASAWRLLAERGWHPENVTLERHAVYTFRGCVADCWRRGRLMLAGDAAHLTPPFAAQGLCAGLRDVAALAWRLDAVLTGQASDDLLESYGPERSPHARGLIEFAIRLGEVICVLDADAAAQRDQAMLTGVGEGPSYPPERISMSPLLYRDDPHAGKLSLQARVLMADRTGLFDDVLGYGWILLGLDHDPGARLDAKQHEFLTGLNARVVHIGKGGTVQDIDGAYRRWFDELSCNCVLIRPDFYLFGAGEPAVLVDALMANAIWKSSL